MSRTEREQPSEVEAPTSGAHTPLPLDAEASAAERLRIASSVVLDGRLRRRILEVYGRAAQNWSHAPSVLARELRQTRDLHSRERRFLGEAVYALIRWRRRLAFIAVGADDAPPLHLLLSWLGSELPPSSQLAAELDRLGLVPERVSNSDRLIGLIQDPVVRLGVQHSYPDWLVRRLLAELGQDETSALLAAMNHRAPLTVRANRVKGDADMLRARLLAEGVSAQPVPLCADALHVDTHLNVYGLQSFREGLFEVQDVGSQLIAEIVAPPPRGVVLDACAGAGGKTLALGAQLGNRGRLIALDPNERKLVELRQRARRAGLSNVEARSLAQLGTLPAADRVLTDVPCSGVGVVRRNPEARWRLTPRDLDELPHKQRQILETYASAVAPGGRLIYATCTVLSAENDRVVDGFLADQPIAGARFEPVPLKEIVGTTRALAIGDGDRLRVMPHRQGTDGFFAAVLRRR